MSIFIMPLWDCPSCRSIQQADDYYDLRSGDALVCNKCEHTFEIESVETVMEIELKDSPVACNEEQVQP